MGVMCLFRRASSFKAQWPGAASCAGGSAQCSQADPVPCSRSWHSPRASGRCVQYPYFLSAGPPRREALCGGPPQVTEDGCGDEKSVFRGCAGLRAHRSDAACDCCTVQSGGRQCGRRAARWPQPRPPPLSNVILATFNALHLSETRPGASLSDNASSGSVFIFDAHWQGRSDTMMSHAKRPSSLIATTAVSLLLWMTSCPWVQPM